MLVVSAQDSNYFAYHSTCCSGVITHSVHIVEEYASFVGYSDVDLKTQQQQGIKNETIMSTRNVLALFCFTAVKFPGLG